MLNSRQLEVFKDRYALEGETEIKEGWRRLAREIAQSEVERDIFYDTLEDFDFVPAGRIWAGAGNDGDRTLFNCFVLPIKPDNKEAGSDSRQAIMDSIKRAVEICARGGGVGFNWSVLRPKDHKVVGINGISSGSVSWLQVADEAINQVVQGGSRRGAMMAMLNVWHPDICDFITAKEQEGTLETANLSVGITEGFMEAVKNDEDWTLKFPDTSHPKYDKEWNGILQNWEDKGYPVVEYETVKASELFDLIAEYAYESGEPGVVFLDRYNEYFNLYDKERINCTNPCGEQGLDYWGVCNLGAINLANFVEDGKVHWEDLSHTVQGAVRFLDNIIDKNEYVYDGVKEKQLKYRRIGLGTMGYADMLVKMGYKYGSEDALEFTDNIFDFIKCEAYLTSINLAKDKGIPEGIEPEKIAESKFIQESLPPRIAEDIRENGLRNATILTQAPTGTTARLADVNWGIEPFFSDKYTETTNMGTEVVEHPLADREAFVTTMNDLNTMHHLKTQATIQKHIDTSISKTVNAPNSQTLAEMRDLFELAYDLGCKGVTYYREGTREGVLNSGDNTEDTPSNEIKPKERPIKASGETIRKDTGCGKLYLTINYDKEGKPLETFITTGSNGGCQVMTEAVSRLVSLGLRSGISPQEIADQLHSTSVCPSFMYQKGKGDNLEGKSCPDVVARALVKQETNRVVKGGLVTDSAEVNENKGGLVTNPADEIICPECGEALQRAEGCFSCSCGYSNCG